MNGGDTRLSLLPLERRKEKQLGCFFQGIVSVVEEIRDGNLDRTGNLHTQGREAWNSEINSEISAAFWMRQREWQEMKPGKLARGHQGGEIAPQPARVFILNSITYSPRHLGQVLLFLCKWNGNNKSIDTIGLLWELNGIIYDDTGEV